MVNLTVQPVVTGSADLLAQPMYNLLAGTGIGTVFLDYNLHILRFTPAASTIINLILSDLGRPVGHIVSNLVGYDSLVADTQAVLNTLIPKDVEVQTDLLRLAVVVRDAHEKFQLMRIYPANEEIDQSRSE